MPPPANKMIAAGASKDGLVEYVPKHSVEKKIEPSQTRFPTSTTSLLKRRRAFSALEASDHGSSTEYTTDDASTDLDATLNDDLARERARYVKRQRKANQTLVNMTPQIVPGSRESTASPITTWGTVSGTPLVLKKDEKVPDGSVASFSLPKDDREKAARKAQALGTGRGAARDHSETYPGAALPLFATSATGR